MAHTTEDHKLFKKVWIHAQVLQTAKRRQENLKWEGVIGSLTSATAALNFETDKAVVMHCSISSEFLTLRCL